MQTVSRCITFLIATALMQNVVLTTGFGSSVMLRIVRRPKDVALFTGILTLFSLLTTALSYPMDHFMGTGFWYKLFRPLMIIAIAAVIYIATALVMKYRLPNLFRRAEKLMPMAAFNNVVIGLAMIANHKMALNFFEALALSLGSCIGFLILASLMSEVYEKTDNPDMPAAFRGLPAMLVFLGILALGLMGFDTGFSLI